MKKELLTLVIPLLDRHALTNRALAHLQNNNCNFNILVADGSELPFFKFFARPLMNLGESPIPAGFANPDEKSLQKHYGSLNIEYFYNGHDYNIAKYMNKMSLAFKRIESPLCMVLDNDDLVDLSGVKSGIDFMAKNLDYSTYQNDVKTLNLKPRKSLGPSLYTKNSLEQEEPRERLLDVVENFNSFNYAIFRTPIAKCFFEIMDEMNNDDFQLFQKCWAYFAAVFGKCKRLHNESYYYFIPGNSILQHGGKVHKFSSWMETPYWQTSAPVMVSIISTVFAELHGVDIRDEFTEIFVGEACAKNEKNKTKKNLQKIKDYSKQYDSTIQNVLTRSSFEYLKFDYDNTDTPTYEDFLQSLS